jgi:3-oxoacyl-[acyl-carrier protein] reductase
MNKRHAGRIVAITGGSGGIGQAMVLRLVREGAKVAVIDIADAPETIALAKQEGASTWLQMRYQQLGTNECRERQVRADLGNPDILVHCAASIHTALR